MAEPPPFRRFIECKSKPIGTLKFVDLLSNDPGKVDSNFFCYAATVLSPHRESA